MDEFALIRRHFAELTPGSPDMVIGIGDDAAVLRPPPGEELVATTDTLVEGRHFRADWDAADVGWRALAVNLSDLAAMGAQPRWFLLALTLPQADDAWLAGFAAGLRELALREGIVLAGGNTARGPLSITITALGSVPAGTALRRDGGRPGDLVCVTGTLGDAALGLVSMGSDTMEKKSIVSDPIESASLRRRLLRPEPRVAAGLALRGLATAAIDLSDGLAGDLGHVLAASRCGAGVRADLLPASPAFAARVADPAQRLRLQAAGGDDYELCVCLPAQHLALAQSRLRVPLTVVGALTSEPGLKFYDGAGTQLAFTATGYRHFQ